MILVQPWNALFCWSNGGMRLVLLESGLCVLKQRCSAYMLHRKRGLQVLDPRAIDQKLLVCSDAKWWRAERVLHFDLLLPNPTTKTPTPSYVPFVLHGCILATNCANICTPKREKSVELMQHKATNKQENKDIPFIEWYNGVSNRSLIYGSDIDVLYANCLGELMRRPNDRS